MGKGFARSENKVDPVINHIMVDPLLTYKWGNVNFWIVSSTVDDCEILHHHLARLNAYKSWDKRINGMFTIYQLAQDFAAIHSSYVMIIPIHSWRSPSEILSCPRQGVPSTMEKAVALSKKKLGPKMVSSLKSVEILCWNLLKSIEIWNFEFSKWAKSWRSLMFEFRSRPPEDPTRALQTAKAKDRTGKKLYQRSMLSIVEYLEDLDNCGNFPLRTPTLRIW